MFNTTTPNKRQYMRDVTHYGSHTSSADFSGLQVLLMTCNQLIMLWAQNWARWQCFFFFLCLLGENEFKSNPFYFCRSEKWPDEWNALNMATHCQDSIRLWSHMWMKHSTPILSTRVDKKQTYLHAVAKQIQLLGTLTGACMFMHVYLQLQ